MQWEGWHQWCNNKVVGKGNGSEPGWKSNWVGHSFSLQTLSNPWQASHHIHSFRWRAPCCGSQAVQTVRCGKEGLPYWEASSKPAKRDISRPGKKFSCHRGWRKIMGKKTLNLDEDSWWKQWWASDAGWIWEFDNPRFEEAGNKDILIMIWIISILNHEKRTFLFLWLS